MTNAEMRMKKTQRNMRNIKMNVFCYAMMFPAIVSFCVFYIYVNFQSIVMAFQEVLPTGGYKLGFGNFKFFFDEISHGDSLFNEALVNSLIFYVCNTYMDLPVALIFCYFIYKRIWGYNTLRVFIYLPNIIIGTVTSALFKQVIALNGPIAVFIEQFGWKMQPLYQTSSTAMPFMVFYNFFYGIGGNFILLGGAMNAIPEETMEAAKLDGCGWVRELVQLVIPMCWPTLSTMLITSMAGLFTSSGPILLFTKGAYGTYTISYWLYECLLNGNNLEIGAAIGIIFTIITAPIVLGFKHLMFKLDDKIGV